MIAAWQEIYDKPRQCVKKQRYQFANEGPYSQGYGLYSSHVWMWELDSKEGRALKNWIFCTVVLEKTLESPLDSKEIKSVNLKWNQSWILFVETEAETPLLWTFDAKSWLIGKDPDAGKNWRQKKKRATDGWMASPIQQIQTWPNSRRCWRTGKKSGMLQSMGSGRIGHDLITEQQEQDDNILLTRERPPEATLKEPKKLIKLGMGG